MTRWALLVIAVVVAGCAHRPISTNMDVRCADAHPGGAVQVITDPDGGECSSLVVRVLENNAPLEPGSIRIFPRDVSCPAKRRKCTPNMPAISRPDAIARSSPTTWEGRS